MLDGQERAIQSMLSAMIDAEEGQGSSCAINNHKRSTGLVNRMLFVRQIHRSSRRVAEFGMVGRLVTFTL